MLRSRNTRCVEERWTSSTSDCKHLFTFHPGGAESVRGTHWRLFSLSGLRNKLTARNEQNQRFKTLQYRFKEHQASHLIPTCFQNAGWFVASVSAILETFPRASHLSPISLWRHTFKSLAAHYRRVRVTQKQIVLFLIWNMYHIWRLCTS